MVITKNSFQIFYLLKKAESGTNLGNTFEQG
jgi:hypothetical protein